MESFPLEICRLIADYTPKYKLKPWVDRSRLDLRVLASNPNAVDYIASLPPDKWIIEELCKNPNATDLIRNNLFFIAGNEVEYLSENPNAIDILEANPMMINWSRLSMNPAAKKLLLANKHRINYGCLSANPADFALDLLEANPSCISWRLLSMNPSDRALKLLIDNPDNIAWQALCCNKNKKAIDYLLLHPDKIDAYVITTNPAAIDFIKSRSVYWWRALFSNPAAGDLIKEKFPPEMRREHIQAGFSKHPANIEILEKDPELRCYRDLSKNPAIFEPDFNPDVYKRLADVKW